MAILQLEDSTIYNDLGNISRELATLNIQLKHCPVEKNLDLPELLAQDILSLAQKEQVLQAVDNHFEELKRTGQCLSWIFSVASSREILPRSL